MKCERAVQLFTFSPGDNWHELARRSTWTGHGAARPDTSLRPGTAALLRSEVRTHQPLRPKGEARKEGHTGGRGRGGGDAKGREPGSQKSLKSKAGDTPHRSNRINYAEHFKLRDTFPLPGEHCGGLLWTEGSPGTVQKTALCFFSGNYGELLVSTFDLWTQRGMQMT